MHYLETQAGCHHKKLGQDEPIKRGFEIQKLS